MTYKKIMVSILIIILLLSLLLYFYNFFLNTKEEANHTNKESFSHQDTPKTSSHIAKERDISPYTVKENKYYIVYIQYNESGSSFVPLTLNPGFKNDSSYNVSISFDDNGNITNGEKIIVIDNFLISEENKKMIKKIAGLENYDEALKEIEDRVIDTKINLEKEGKL